MKTVLITGASRGIGSAIAHAFAQKGGWNLVLNCNTSADALREVQKEIESAGAAVCASVGDIADPSYVHALFAEARRQFGSVDVLICNAGIDWFGLIQDTSCEEWNRILSVNLSGVFYCAKEAIPLMLKKKEGSILNISSVFGSTGGSCEAAYSASKGGVNAFTRAAARELAPSGIRVNALALGAVDTQMNARLNPEEKAALENEIPLGRMGTPAEAAQLAYTIAADSSYLTGEIITMDGGWT